MILESIHLLHSELQPYQRTFQVSTAHHVRLFEQVELLLISEYITHLTLLSLPCCWLYLLSNMVLTDVLDRVPTLSFTLDTNADL